MKNSMTEAQQVGLVRNALLVAGYEMGDKAGAEGSNRGDHWPVINATIHSIARDWEEAQIQKDVDAEMKIHLYEQLEIMERGMADCSAPVRAELTPKLKILREVYDSYFSELNEDAAAHIQDEEIPVHLKRAQTIIATLGEAHE